jgi:DNA-binding CsgD family transcriptional regulator
MANRGIALSKPAIVRARTITTSARLTPGELGTALQAAAGRSNKQIASDMCLSVRTVESHLQRVYEKLGVSGRHELVDVLGVRVTVDFVE